MPLAIPRDQLAFNLKSGNNVAVDRKSFLWQPGRLLGLNIRFSLVQQVFIS